MMKWQNVPPIRRVGFISELLLARLRNSSIFGHSRFFVDICEMRDVAFGLPA